MASANHLGAALVDDGDINILLLGESGVGKSTFINSMVNYLQHETLEDVLQKELTCLIPSKFSISDENYETQEVHIGSDENEDANIGNSSTQGARSYVFHINKNSKCRIIDTPGIGDARGLDKDSENFDNILTYISQYKYLHGICFLLKPNVTVINAYFKLCLIYLLSRLDKSASRNIIFIFTNSRGTFYRPGETLTLLRRILSEIEEAPPHVKVPCQKENIFCVDNEAFKFVAAMKQGVKFGDKEKAEFSKSWATSCATVKSLLRYVQDEKKMMPHQVQSTLSINEVRQSIMDLLKPLADITEYIRNNVIMLKTHMEEISRAKLSKEELEQRLYVPGVTIQLVPLAEPMTVCSSAKCTELISYGRISQRLYNQCCHNPCHLKGIPKEIIGPPELRSCAVFTGTKCTVCYCDVSLHMHIYYKTEARFEEQKDLNVQTQMLSKSKLVTKKGEIIKEIKQKSKEFENEQRIILNTMAKFAFFLNENSISHHNDAYLQYLNSLIEREESLGENVNNDLLNNFKQLRTTYQAEIENLNEAKKKGLTQSSKFSISISEVLNCIKKLFELRWNGKTIEEFYTKQRKLKHQEVSQMEYLHPTILSDDSSENCIRGKQNVISGKSHKQNSDNVKQNPSNVNQKTSNDSETPSNVNRNPSNVNQNPSKVNQNLSNAKQNPSNANQTPSNVKQNPDNFNQNPNIVNQITSFFDWKIGNSNLTPSHSDLNPYTSNPNPQTPSHSILKPYNSNLNLCNSNTNPVNLNQTVDNSNLNTGNFTENRKNSYLDPHNNYSQNSTGTNQNPDGFYFGPHSFKCNSDSMDLDYIDSMDVEHENANRNISYKNQSSTDGEQKPCDFNQKLSDPKQTPSMCSNVADNNSLNLDNKYPTNFNNPNTDNSTQVGDNSTCCNKKESPSKAAYEHSSHSNASNEESLKNEVKMFMLFEQFFKFKQFLQGNQNPSINYCNSELNLKKGHQIPTNNQPSRGDVQRYPDTSISRDQSNSNFTRNTGPNNSSEISMTFIRNLEDDPSTYRTMNYSPQANLDALNEDEQARVLFNEFKNFCKMMKIDN